MATDVIYNGVKLHNVITRQWVQRVEYDESSTDVVAHRFVLRFEGVLHVQGSGSDVSETPVWIADPNGQTQGASVPATYKWIRARLMEARGVLEVTMNDQQVLRCNPSTHYAGVADPDRDVANGPFPREVVLTKIASDQVYRVTFSVECAKVECLDGSPPPAVLNNRWSVGESMDENFFITRTIRGKVTFSMSELEHARFQGIVTPNLEKGFRRERVEMTVAPDGLKAEYQIVDRQTHDAAPWPSTKITGSHTETTGDGVNFWSECNVRLEGPPNVPKTLLITRAVQVMESRLKIRGLRKLNENFLVEQAAIIDHFGDANAVEVRMRIRQMFKDAKNYLARLRIETLGSPIVLPELDVEGAPEGESDPTKSRYPALHGYDPHAAVNTQRDAAHLFILGCYLQKPCDNRHAVGTWQDSPGEGDDEDENTNTPTTSIFRDEGPVEDDDEDNYSEAMKDAIYTLARMETTYTQDRLRAQMPIARSLASDAVVQEKDEEPANDVDTSVVFDLGLGVAQREIKYEAERIGIPPEIPKPKDKYTDGTLKGTKLRHWVRTHPPVLSNDGVKYVYKISAYYLYALNRPPREDEAVNVGVLPYTKRTQEENQLDHSKLYQEELGP